MSSVLSLVGPHPAVQTLLEDSSSSAPLKVVCFGGGTGLSTLLRGLKRHVASANHPSPAAAIESITAVVAVMDDGGSSGRLRSDFEILPPGDIRNCLVALAEDEALLSRLFDYRFSSGTGLAGHSLGNLLITALADITGDFSQAVKVSSEMLATRGRVLPATTTHAQLCAELVDGTRVVGETAVGTSGTAIRKLTIDPADCEPLPDTLQAIAEADLITLGPGSLFTSLLPHLLVRGIPEAIAASPAAKVFICNIMTQASETLGFTAADHLRAAMNHAGRQLFDAIVLNTETVPPRTRARYAEEGAVPVSWNEDQLQALGVSIATGAYLSQQGIARHNPHRLAADLIRVARAHGTRNFQPVLAAA